MLRLINFKNRIRYREKITYKMEIFDANVLIRLVIEENSIVMSAQPTLACKPKFLNWQVL